MVIVEIGGSPGLSFDDQFAVAVLGEGGSLHILQTYPTRDALQEAYRTIHDYCVGEGIFKTPPVPVEKVDENWKCKVLDDIVIE